MLSMGAEIADGVFLDAIHEDFLKENLEIIRKGMEVTGNKPKLSYSTMIITNEKVLEEFRPVMFWRLLEPPQNVREAIGLTEADTEALRAEFAANGMKSVGKLIKDQWLEPFVIMGSIEECAKKLSKLMKENQFDEFILPILSVETTPDLLSDIAKVIALANKG